MPKILIVASTTGYQTRIFAETAVRLGYEVQLATDRCHRLDNPWADHAIPLRFQHPEAAVRTIAENIGAKPDAIVAPGDRPAYIAALAAARFGLPGNPPSAVFAARSKFLARERFREARLLAPGYSRVPLDADVSLAAAAATYPCVLKPLGLSASRGVIRADSPAEFATAFERIQAILDSPEILRMRDEQDRFIQVEDFIPGREFALEGLLTGGCLETLAIFDKPDPLDGPFFEETIYVTPSREPEPVQAAIMETTQRAVDALGLTTGPVHAEMRVNDRGVWMLEVAARPIGGMCAQILRFEGGETLEGLILRHALGEPFVSKRLADASRGVMMIPIPREGVYTGVQGVVEASAVKGIESIEITAKEGQHLLPLPEGSSYLGFIFARGESADTVEEALRAAHAKLDFQIAHSLKVIGMR